MMPSNDNSSNYVSVLLVKMKNAKIPQVFLKYLCNSIITIYFNYTSFNEEIRNNYKKHDSLDDSKRISFSI